MVCLAVSFWGLLAGIAVALAAMAVAGVGVGYLHARELDRYK